MGPIQVYGEFHLSSSLARRVSRAVTEIVKQNTLDELSHVDDDCPLCRTGEVPRDASEPDRAGRQWVA